MLADDAPAIDAPAFLAAGMSNAQLIGRPSLTLGGQPSAIVLALEITTRAEGAPAPEPPPPVPSIVTSGLVLHCDFGDAGCYPGSGTAFTDLSGNGNNGTLTNGPTYSAADGGQIVFDGVNDIALCGNAASLRTAAATLEVWAKLPSTNTGLRYFFGKESAHSIITDNKILCVVDEGAVVRRSTGIDVCDNAWRQILLTTSGTATNNSIVYLNGVAVLTTTTSVLSQSFDLAIGAAAVSGLHSQGSVAIARYYNRALSAAEISQNFNAQKARFGL